METIKSGFILINKPLGLSSHAVINCLRRLSGIKKIGHAGTLDPLATGLLIVAVGRDYTKRINDFVKLDKEYMAELYLGATTASYDKEAEIKKNYQGDRLQKKIIKNSLKLWRGRIAQRPPLYSAKKIAGQKLYNLARRGQSVAIKTCPIEIYKLKILKYSWPLLKIKVACSSGTYIRSLAHDLGQTLGCGAYLNNLERVKIGKLSLKKAIKLSKLSNKNLNRYLKKSL